MFTQDEISLLTNHTRQLKTKIQLLDWNENVLDELQGVCIDGSITSDINSAQRYAGSITLVVKNQSYIPGSTNKFWLNKKVKVYVGLYSPLTEEIIWWNQGIFILNKPKITDSSSEKNIQFDLCDQMAFYDGTLGGNISSTMEAKYGTGASISEVIKSLLIKGGCNKFNIDIQVDANGVVRTLPYDFKKDAGTTYYECIKELGSLYMNWEYYFDRNGYFCFKKILNRLTDPIAYDSSQLNKIIIKNNLEPNWSNVKNYVEIWGRVASDGTQPHSIVQNNDSSNPYSIPSLGQTRTLVETSSTIYTQSQCDLKAKYELIQHSNFNEKVTIECAPIYNFDVNYIVNFDREDIGVIGKYITQKFSYGFKADSTMSVELCKLYDNSINI